MTFRFKGLVAAAAASALVASPALAAGTPAQSPAASLSIAHARAAAPTKGGQRIAEGGTATLINVGILAALAAVVLLVVVDDGDDSDSN